MSIRCSAEDALPSWPLAIVADVRAASFDVVDIVAHRGSSGSAPENTLAAVELAVHEQATFVEVDVQRSADGELVVVHDTCLARTTDAVRVFPDRAPWRVAEFTRAELDRLDAGVWYGPEFVGEPIPTLSEVLDTIGGVTGLLLELKAPKLYPGIEAQVVDELASRGEWLAGALRSDRLMVQSFRRRSVRNFADLAPDMPAGLLFWRRPTSVELVAASRWVRQVNLNLRVANQRLVDQVHALGMTTGLYTANTVDRMRDCVALGADAVITDYPLLLQHVLARPEVAAA